MKKTILSLAGAIATVGLMGGLTVGLMGGAGGCRDVQPPPPRTPVPPPQAGYNALPPPAPRVEHDAIKPLPAQQPPQAGLMSMPYDDEPLVSQQLPEQAAFIDTYNRVNRPRITVFVNRTLQGDVIPVNPTHTGKDLHDTYLRQGQYDDAWASSLDYEALEAEITDWLSCDGQVTIVSPTLARQKLTDAQVKDLQSGRPQALSEIAQELGADILIQVQAHPTEEYQDGLRLRVVAEAMNTHGDESLARVVEDLPLPLEKTRMNQFTRFMARKLMDEMIRSWVAPPPGPATPGSTGPESGSSAPSAATATPAAPSPAPVAPTAPVTPTAPSAPKPVAPAPVPPPLPSSNP